MARHHLVQSHEVGFGSIPGIAPVKALPARKGAAHSPIANDDVSFGCVLDVPWRVTQLGRSADLQPGDGVLLSNADLDGLSIPRACRYVTFGLPRVALAQLVPDLGALFARRIPAVSPGLQMLLRYLDLGHDQQIAADPDLQAAFTQHVCDLLALTLIAIRDVAERMQRAGPGAIRLRAMQAIIRRSCRQPDLSVHAVAARQGVSARYAQRLFEESGCTFTEYLTEQRLLAAHRALSRSWAAQIPVSSIALDCGFSDISHFNRLFRRRFDCTPRDVLRKTRHLEN